MQSTETELRARYGVVYDDRSVAQHYYVFARLPSQAIAVVTRCRDGAVGTLRMQQTAAQGRFYYDFQPASAQRDVTAKDKTAAMA